MIFRKIEHQQEFDKRGYIIIPVLDEKNSNEINKDFNFKTYGIEKPFFISIDIKNTDLRKSVQKTIKNKLETNTNITNILNYEFILYSSSFISQINEKDSGFYLHTDWSFFDQTKYSPVYTCIPLQNIAKDKNNGTMVVVPGSHKISIPYRGEGITEHYISIILTKFSHYFEYLNVPKGHAVFFNPAIVHGLLPNTVNDRNVSIFCLMCEKNAEIIYCYKAKYSFFNRVKVYKVHEIDDYWYVKTGQKNKSCLQYIKTITIPNTRLSDK